MAMDMEVALSAAEVAAVIALKQDYERVREQLRSARGEVELLEEELERARARDNSLMEEHRRDEHTVDRLREHVRVVEVERDQARGAQQLEEERAQELERVWQGAVRECRALKRMVEQTQAQVGANEKMAKMAQIVAQKKIEGLKMELEDEQRRNCDQLERLGVMHQSLSMLEEQVQSCETMMHSSDLSCNTNQSTQLTSFSFNAVNPYEPTSFLESCSKLQLIERVRLIKGEYVVQKRRLYSGMLVASTIWVMLIIILTHIFDDKTESAYFN